MSLTNAVLPSPRSVLDPAALAQTSPLLWGALDGLPARGAHHRRHAGPFATRAERFLVIMPPRTLASTAGDPANSRTLPPTLVAAAPHPQAVYHARRTLTLVLEVWAQSRPPIHLDRLLDPTAARYIHVVGTRLRARRVRSARLYSMRICHPHPDAAEVAAVCLIGRRPRALAARFERCAEGPAWRLHTLQLG